MAFYKNKILDDNQSEAEFKMDTDQAVQDFIYHLHFDIQHLHGKAITLKHIMRSSLMKKKWISRFNKEKSASHNENKRIRLAFEVRE